MDYLFIAGCARSGTTAMARLLNHDPRILIGIERYKYIPRDIRRTHFYKEAFLNPNEKETNILKERMFQQFRQKWERGQLQIIGDKVPEYYRLMPHLAQTFPNCKVIFMLRDLLPVASSFNVRAYDAASTSWPEENDYRRAVKEWNASLGHLKQAIKMGYGRQIFIIKYEQFYSGKMASLNTSYDFLSLKMRPHFERVFEKMTEGWVTRSSKNLILTEAMRTYLEEHKDHRLEQWVLDRLNGLSQNEC